MTTKVPGFIGWVGHHDIQNHSKLYVSNLSDKEIDQSYHSFTSEFSIELIKINSNQPIQDAFLGAFAFSHNEFNLVSKPTGCTLKIY